MLNRIAGLACMLALLAPPAALAQWNSAQLRAASSQAKDIEFPAEPAVLASTSAPQLALFKPDGQGPFAALVLQHQCSGLRWLRWQNFSMLGWAKDAVARGYVVLLMDSLGPRNVDTVCMGPRGGVNFARGVRDALQAAEHLRTFPFVDKKRVALVGFSWGAMVGTLASSKHWASALSLGDPFAAVVAFYPGCFTIRPPNVSAFEIVNTDIGRPLLVLMGDQDVETPPAECVPRLEAARAAGAPVQWHVYQGATHCWDCENLNGFSKVDFRGSRVVYQFDKEVTEDSARRTFEFLQKALH